METKEILCIAMFGCLCGALMLGFPVAFTIAGVALIFGIIATVFFGIDVDTFMSAFPSRILGIEQSEVLVAVPLFVFMGVMLERSRVAEELLDNMGKAFGTLRGGLGISVCIVGALLAASTGIVGATVVTMGLISLPTMLRRGYDPALACGAISASGTLGQIIPPSIVLILLGDALATAYQKAQLELGNFSPDTVSVNDLFAGALFPGLVLVGMYILYLIFIAIVRPHTSPAIPRDEIGVDVDGRSFAKQLLHSLVAPIVLIVAVLGSILGGLASPTEAAGVGAAGAIMLAGYRLDEARARPILIGGLCLVLLLVLTSFFDLRIQRDSKNISDVEWVAIGAVIVLTVGLAWGLIVGVIRTYGHRFDGGNRVLHDVMRTTMEISSMVFIILVGARMFSLVFRGLGGDEMIEAFLKDLPGGTVGAMLLVMGAMFVLGFFLDFLEIVFIVVPIVSPILLQMNFGVDAAGQPIPMSPVWLGVMMGVNLQTSYLTPPFGFALFYLRGAAPDSVTTMDIYRGVIPFVGIQLLALLVLWYLPGLATWLPTAIYG